MILQDIQEIIQQIQELVLQMVVHALMLVVLWIIFKMRLINGLVALDMIILNILKISIQFQTITVAGVLRRKKM